jgi:hypothetical protein
LDTFDFTTTSPAALTPISTFASSLVMAHVFELLVLLAAGTEHPQGLKYQKTSFRTVPLLHP